jgi:CelD/BcsL family acetyltransferase involved in cellulose biosynthesis
MLADPACELSAARLFFDYLADTRGEWHVCDLDELRAGSPLLRTELPDDLVARRAPCSVCPVLPLPRSMDQLLASLAPKFRKNLRQAESRLLRDGAVFQTVPAAEVEEAMRSLFSLHAARWQQRRESGVLASGALQRFHLDAAGRLARAGLLRLNTLRIHGATVAVQYNLWRDGRLFYYLSGFDPAHARRSPGAALLAWSIRSAIEEGAVEVDFLRHREAYKYEWGARDRVNRKLLVSPSAAGARDVA